MPFFIVSVPRRKEVLIARMLFGSREGEGVYSIYVGPEATKALTDRSINTPGYIIIEAEDEMKVYNLMSKLVNVRRKFLGEADPEEIKELIHPKTPLKPGMTVRILYGPFAGSRAVVEKVIENKRQVGLRLLDEFAGFTPYIEVPIDSVIKESESGDESS